MTRRPILSIVCAIWGLQLVAPLQPLAAQPTVQSTISLQTSGTARTRARALDQAFANAIRSALSQQLTDEQRKANRNLLQKHLIARARLYIASYKVLAEGGSETGYNIRIAAAVKITALRKKLQQLGIGLAIRTLPATGRRLIFYPQITIDGTAQNSIEGWTRELQRWPRRLATRDMVVALARNDAEATRLARKHRANGLIRLRITTTNAGRIRATALQGLTARATLTITDNRRNKEVAKFSRVINTYAKTPALATGRALRRLQQELGDDVYAAIASYWPSPRAATPGTTLKIHGAPDWQSVRRITRRLKTSPRVSAITPFFVRTAEIVYDIQTTLSPQEIATIVQATRWPSGRIKASTAGGDGVQVLVTR